MIVALLSATALVIGAWRYPGQALHAYMWAYQLALGCSLGALAVRMIHDLVGGGWGRAIRGPLEAASSVLPWLALAFIPIALATPRPLEPYFAQPWFIARAVAYFAIWSWLARARGISAPGLVLYALTSFFAAVDWIMALEPGWYSTAIGLVYAAGQIVLGFVVGILGLPGRPAAQQLNDLGNLLLAATMSWAYLAYAQYLVVWAGNLTADVPWYVHRSNGGWQDLIVALVLLHFAVPCGLLLFRAVKRDPRALAAVAATVGVGQALHFFWQITPAIAPLARVTWLDLAALALAASAWRWAYAAHPGEAVEDAG